MFVCIYAYLYPKAAGISQLSILKPCLNLLYSLTGIIHTVYSIIRDTSIYIQEKAIHSMYISTLMLSLFMAKVVHLRYYY